MKLGIDYSLGRPNLACAKQTANISFICRYLSWPGNPKNITVAEVVAAKALDLDIVLVYESSANRALGGSAAGRQDAEAADAQLVQLGLEGAPVFFAVDFDAKDYAPAQPNDAAHARLKLGTIGDYLAAAGTVLGVKRVGVYGGYWVVKRAFDAGLVTYGWQTFAWSGGFWDPRAQLQQVKNGQALCGGEVDYDRALQDDFGQATRTPAPVPPVPAPVPVPPPVSTKGLRADLRALILNWKARGKSWAQIGRTHAWKLYRNLGGK